MRCSVALKMRGLSLRSSECDAPDKDFCHHGKHLGYMAYCAAKIGVLSVQSKCWGVENALGHAIH